MKLDTLVRKADWHKTLNFKISEWLEYDENDSLVTENVDKEAFDFPRKSGKIIAEYRDNTFQIKTSRIRSFQINISPEMVNLKKKVKVYVNGKRCFDRRIKYDQVFMLQNFEENKDRKQVWVNFVGLKI